MKRTLLAMLLASATLATAPSFANDVASVVPPAPIGTAPVSATTAAAPAYVFGNADVVSVIPETPAGTAPVRKSVATGKPAPFGNPDVTCTM